MLLRPRHLRRYSQIAQVLSDYGFGALLAQLGLSDRLNLPRRIFRRKAPEDELSAARRVRLALEELGPTFIKLGQIASVRPDLLPPAFLEELSQLQDNVAPLPWEAMREVLESELEAPVEALFLNFETDPIASASLAQVYRARLPDGKRVVVKILRPGIEERINTDLDILYDLSKTAQGRTSIGERFEVAELAVEFSNALLAELDFRREGRNADQFRQNFEAEPQIYVPEIYWEFTTRRVLVQEEIRGIKIDDLEALKKAGYDRKALAEASARFILQEVLEDGFFHADPHPGNLLVMKGGVIGVLDFGTVGLLDRRDRINLARLFVEVVQLDSEAVVDQLIRMGVADFRVNRRALERDLRRVLLRYYGLPINEISASEVVEAIQPIIFDHRLRIPSNYWLLVKTVIIMQGVGLGLDPEFDIFEASRPFLGRLFRQVWLPSTWAPSLARSAMEWSELASTFPRRSNRILDQLERGELGVQAYIPDLRDTNTMINQIVNRIIFGILVAAFIVALALLIPQLDFSWPWNLVTWVILGGFVVMSMLALFLLWSILRSMMTGRNDK